MITLYRAAHPIVVRDIFLVTLIGILSVRIETGALAYLSLAGFFASILLEIILYGRIISRVTRAEPLPAITTIKQHGLNYLIVTLLLATPVILFVTLNKALPLSPALAHLGQEALSAIISMAAIYVIPVVFIKGENLIAIFVGISYLIQNIQRSLPLIGVVAFAYIVKSGAGLGLLHMAHSVDDLFYIIPAMMLVIIFVTYLMTLIFTMASIMMIGQRTERVGQ